MLTPNKNGEGGYLGMHVDASHHGIHKNWKREFSAILCLSEEYDSSFDLRVHNGKEHGTIPYKFNQLNVFKCSDNSWHGLPEITKGMDRKTLGVMFWSKMTEEDKSREKIDCRYRHFEDFCYNILYFKRDSGILRYNGFAPSTKNYNPIGGIASEVGGMDKRLDCEKIADEIIDRFGNKCVSKYFKKKSARGPACFNLRLNWRVSPHDIL
mgnify:CR=1 FL=1